MAKEILDHRREIALPKPSDPTKLYAIEKVNLEKRLGDIVPDVTAYIEGRPILIEVVVTHDINEQKRRAIRELGISTLVIDLSGERRTLSKDELAQILVEGTEKKHWEFNVAWEKKRQRQLETARRFKVIARGYALHIDGCPIPARLWHGNPYANVMWDCAHCEFLVEWGAFNQKYMASDPIFPEDTRQSLLNDPEPEGFILCGYPKIAEQFYESSE